MYTDYCLHNGLVLHVGGGKEGRNTFTKDLNRAIAIFKAFSGKITSLNSEK